MQTVADLKEHLGVAPTCAAMGVPRSSFYRHQRPPGVSAPRRTPPRALSPAERETCSSQKLCLPIQSRIECGPNSS